MTPAKAAAMTARRKKKAALEKASQILTAAPLEAANQAALLQPVVANQTAMKVAMPTS
jgi:hypothetical protein